MDGTSRTFTSQYDAASNRTGLSKSDYNVSFTYNPAGQMTGVLETGAAYSYVQFRYDAEGRRSRVEFGPSSSTSLVRLWLRSAGTPRRAEPGPRRERRRPECRLRLQSRIADRHAHQHQRRLCQQHGAQRQPRLCQERAQPIYRTTSNGSPSATFAYDANGNLTSDGSTSFVYDAENRLVSASGAKTASLAYDPLGRLWQTSGGTRARPSSSMTATAGRGI